MQSSEELINETHGSTSESLDTDLVFSAAENVLKLATGIVNNIMKEEDSVKSVIKENLKEKTPESLSQLPCILMRLSSKMACKVPDESTADKSTMSILRKVSLYSWDAKAVLAFAAFALEYWNFWFALKHSSELPKFVAILKHVPPMLELQKYRNVIDELQTLIEATSEFIKHIVQFEKKPIHGREVPELENVHDRIPMDVYWAIRTMLVCTTQMYCLVEDENKTQKLSVSVARMKEMLNSLKSDIREYEKQEGEIEEYKKLKRLFRKSNEISEVIFTEVKVKLLDGSTKKLVNIDVLKKKKLLLLISALDISIAEVSVLKQIYHGIMKEEKYRIVWIPMVPLTAELPKDFLGLQSQMPWYIVQGFTSAGMRLIKKVSNFENWPLLLVMNPQGRVEHPNALHMINIWGTKAFPLTITKEKQLLGQENVMGAILSDINQEIYHWIKEEKYIFYYGGKDNSWIEQFKDKATSLKSVMAEKHKISVELLCVENEDKGKDVYCIIGRFWRAIESLFSCKGRKKTKGYSLTPDIRKLLSYKNKNGWAVLYKGSRMVSGGRAVILEVFKHFGEWEGDVPENGFENCFSKSLEKFSKDDPCCYIEIPITAEVEHLKCPYCSSEMETYLSFQCCHVGVR